MKVLYFPMLIDGPAFLSMHSKLNSTQKGTWRGRGGEWGWTNNKRIQENILISKKSTFPIPNSARPQPGIPYITNEQAFNVETETLHYYFPVLTSLVIWTGSEGTGCCPAERDWEKPCRWRPYLRAGHQRDSETSYKPDRRMQNSPRVWSLSGEDTEPFMPLRDRWHPSVIGEHNNTCSQRCTGIQPASCQLRVCTSWSLCPNTLPVGGFLLTQASD